MRCLSLLLLAWLSWAVLIAQATETPQVGKVVPGAAIIQLADPQLSPVWLSNYAPRALSAKLGIYRLQFTPDDQWEIRVADLQHDQRIAAVQYDYRLEWRSAPNDEFFSLQPNLARAGFTRVWEEATGGLTPTGDTIVIAVLDAGFDVTHEDLRPGLWHNPGEIPRDGIDNDGNGFTDDIHGWNFRENRSGFDVDMHGTQVLGILGAQGDNEVGVTGTGWNNRLMIFSVNLVSDIIAAYDYIIDQRRRWQNSGGRDGALVVATNASFGGRRRSLQRIPGLGRHVRGDGPTGHPHRRQHSKPRLGRRRFRRYAHYLPK